MINTLSKWTGPCKHKVQSDHMEIMEGNKIWTCSCCGKKSEWTDNHVRYGIMECDNCWEERIDWVACSDGCAKNLAKDRFGG